MRHDALQHVHGFHAVTEHGFGDFDNQLGE